MLPTARTLEELAILIPGEPFAEPRPRTAVVNGHAVVYKPKASKEWKAVAMHFMMGAVQEAHGQLGFTRGPVAISVLAVFPCPTSQHRKRDPLPRRWHTKRPDGDNVLKAVKDAAKGILWQDDSQVARATVTKIIGAQGEAPYVEIRVRELTEELEPPGHIMEPEFKPPAPGDALSPGAELPLFERRD